MKIETAIVALTAVFAGIYLESIVIVGGLTAAVALMMYSTGNSSSKRNSGSGEEETVLHPVVYEDTGDPPNLYPEDGEISVYPDGKKKRVKAGDMVNSAGIMVKGAAKGLFKMLK